MVGSTLLQKKLVLASLLTVATATLADARAGQIDQVCSATSTLGLPTTIASYASGVTANTCYSVSLNKSGTDKTLDRAVYSRGTGFYLTSSEIPSKYSYSAYDKLLPCLMSCSRSFSGQTLVAQKRAADKKKSIANKPDSSTSTLADKASDAEDQTGNSLSKKTAAIGNSGVDPYKALAAYQDIQEKKGKPQVGGWTDKNGEKVRVTTVDGVVTKTEYGRAENGTINTYRTETDTPTDSKNGTTYSYADPSTGKTVTFTSGDEASKWASLSHVTTGTVSKDGQLYKINAQTGELYRAPEKSSTKTPEELAEEKKNNSDPCSVSAQIGSDHKKDFRCQGTQNLAKATEIGNQVLTGAGRTAINSMGANAAQNAQDGTFAGSQDAAAKMARTSLTYETTLGILNIAATGQHALNAKKHKDALGDLRGWKGEAGKNGGPSFYKNNGDTAVDQNAETGLSQARYDEAIKEQTGAQNLAATAAYKTAIQGAQSIAGAFVAKQNMKAAENNARLARANDNLIRQNTIAYDTNALTSPVDTNVFTPGGLNGNTGTQGLTPPLTTTGGANPNTPGGPSLANGNDTGAGNDSINAPAAGAFKADPQAAGGGGGGGSGSGAGGGGGLGGPSTSEDAKAAYASEFSAKERYESAGAAQGARGGAKGKDDGGIDLNGLLAQFLPKGEEDIGSKHGILDSVAFGGNRNIANEEAPSYLDKNADLFQRIHETMNEKNRRGQLGI